MLAAETDGMFLAGVLLLRIGQVLAGPLAAAVGVREAVVLCAVAVMVAGGLATAVPAVRRLERTDLSLAGPVRG